MSSPRKQVTIYRRYSASGALIAARSGLTLALKAGDDRAGESVTWDVSRAALGGLEPTAERDRIRDDAGEWWTVKTVGALTGDVYPLLCERTEASQ